MMKLSDLKYAITLAKLKSFSKAANACHITQPTLSVAIRKLEDDLGVTLFERNRNTIRITEVGKKIIAQAQRVLDEAYQLNEIAHENKSETKSIFKLGAIFTVAPYLFPKLIPRLAKLAPQMPLIIQEDYTANLRQKLLLGELDAIIISLPFTEKGIITRGLYDETFVAVMRKDHPLSRKANIEAKDIKPSELLLLGEGHCFRDQVLELCPQCRQTSNLAAGTSLETLRHMVISGMGLTILPRTATQIHYYQANLCIKPLQGKKPERRIALCWRSSFTRPKAIELLIKAVQTVKLEGVELIK